jgi:LmbE family N-acetylglucosaminyl deacetylase
MTSGPFTLVSFHAHPDDESLLMGGTLAKASASGNRVVLVTATDGDRGLGDAADGTGAVLAERRRHELDEAAEVLGCARVVRLGYGDSGLRPNTGDAAAFANADVEAAAERLARILLEEHADVLTIYDARGGYGHPDHLQVHRVGTRAARLAGTEVVLEATVDADSLRRVLRYLSLFGHTLGASMPLGGDDVFTKRSLLTHRIDVSRQLSVKKRALAAHRSQRRADGEVRVLARLLRLPGPIFSLVFGHEWFVEHGRRPGRLQDDIFATLRHRRGTIDPTTAPRNNRVIEG